MFYLYPIEYGTAQCAVDRFVLNLLNLHIYEVYITYYDE